MRIDRGWDLRGRTVVVTGANSGIGLATAEALAAMGARLLITARDQRRGVEAVERIRQRSGNGQVELVELDLARLDSVRAAAADILRRAPELHVLINNAGVTMSQRRLTPDGYETTVQVNHLGPFLLTNLLLDRLRASAPARIVVVSSVAHCRADLDLDDLMCERRRYIGLAQYARTKLMNLLFTRELARRLSGTGVVANAVHPGTVRTGFGLGGDATGPLRLGLWIARWFFLSPRQGARPSIYLAAAPEAATLTGGYWTRRGLQAPAPAAYDDVLARRLWDLSEELVGLRPGSVAVAPSA